MPKARQAKVLDIGCAAGRETDYFARHNLDVIGCDISPEFIELAKKKYPDYKFLIADMRKLPFDDDSFDGVWASASFLHIPKDEAPLTLSELMRILRPEGVLYISVFEGSFNGLRDNKQMKWPERHFSDYSAAELEQLITEAGAKILNNISVKTSWGPTFLHFYCQKAK